MSSANWEPFQSTVNGLSGRVGLLAKNPVAVVMAQVTKQGPGPKKESYSTEELIVLRLIQTLSHALLNALVIKCCGTVLNPDDISFFS